MAKKISLLFLAMLLMVPPLLFAEEVYEEETFYGAPGFNPHRKYFNQAFNERVDPYNGNVILTYTDIYLPGDGGLDFKLRRTYNSKIRKEKTGEWDVYDDDLIECRYAGIGWSLGLGKVYPITQIRQTPAVEMPDGSMHPAFLAPHSTIRQTKELWTYKEVQEAMKYADVTLNDGTVYRFRISGFWKDDKGKDVTKLGDWFPLESITDVHGNQIIVTNAIYRGHFVIDKIWMSSGNRTIDFSYFYSGETKYPYEIQVTTPGGQTTATYTYNFQVTTGFPQISMLTSVKLPTGEEWKYEYDTSGSAPYKKYELKRVTYPQGGIIDYEYETIRCRPANIGQYIPSRVVTERRVSGRDLPGGTWNYSYDRGNSDNDYTTITGPNGFEEEYTFYGPKVADSGRNYLIGTLLNKKIYDGSTLAQEEIYTWDHKKTISYTIYQYAAVTGFDVNTWVPLLTKKIVTRDGTSYYTTYSDFDPTYDYFPRKVEETGQKSWTTNVTYWHNSSKHILGLPKNETIISTGGGTFHIERDYTPNGTLQYIDTYGIRTDYTYYSNGNLQREEDELDRGVTYSNYKYGQPETVQTGEYTYSQKINPASTLQSITRSTRTKSGHVSHTTFYTYDGLNRVIRVDTPLESDVVVTYSSDGTTKTVSKGGGWVKYTYDGFGRVSFVQNSEGVKRDINYDPLGRVSYRSYPYSSSNIGDSFSHDILGRLKNVTHPDGTTVNYSYLPGNVTHVTNERGFSTQYSHESFGNPDEKRLVEVVDAASVTTRYQYNTAGSLTTVSQPLIPTRVFTYGTPQGENLLAREYHPENGTTAYGYYSNGVMKSKTDANGNTATYTYDGNNRLRGIDYAGTEYDVTYDYDQSDNRTKVAMPGNVYEYWYNTEDRLQEVSFTYEGQVYTTTYDYDGRGNLKDIWYPSDRHVTYTYDSADRVKTVSGFVTNITYHPSGGMEDLKLSNGVTQSYKYTPKRYWVSSIKAGSVIHLSYKEYDGVGNLGRLTDNLDATRSKSMTYTKLDQLNTADSPILGGEITFTYDAVGNRRSMNSTSYTYNYSTNRLASYTGSSSFTYDNNGNFTNNGAYQYDSSNRLISTGNADYIYNGDGKRIEKIAGSDVTVYHYDQSGQVLAETDENGTLKREYIYANGVHIAKVEPDSDDDGIPDFIENKTCTDAFDADTDDDGILDGVEDSNHNGIVDAGETDPCDLDTDDDGIQDGTELGYTLADIGPDTDTTIFEPDPDPTTTTDPLNPDTDGDGMPDGWEEQYGLNPLDPSDADQDSDGDGYTNLEEYTFGTDPSDPDSHPPILIFGLGETSNGYIEAFRYDYSHVRWLRVGWDAYNSANGETRVATGDVDGDGRDEVVLGLGPVGDDPAIPGGWFELLDDDYTNLAWGRINWSSYNSANGESWPACGDVDGDGKDEIIVGLGSGGGKGWIEIFDYDAGSITHTAWVRVNWSAYNNANGKTRPACGDVDGDGRDEIVVGLGQGAGGYLEIFDDAVAGYSHLALPRVQWGIYNNANGETRPACGDVDGDGRDEIVVGLGQGAGGYLEIFDDASADYAHMAWPWVQWWIYNNANGETRPACGDVDGDGRDEIVVGLGDNGDGWYEVFDDDCTHLTWSRINWSAYNSANGESWPALKK